MRHKLKATWNGPYGNARPGHDRAKELALETLRKKVAELEADATLGGNGSGDVSGPAAHSAHSREGGAADL